MSQSEVYLKCDRNKVLQHRAVVLEDLVEIFCIDAELKNKLRKLSICRIDEKTNRNIVSCITLAEKIMVQFPDVSVQILGEPEMLVEYEAPNRQSKGFKLLKTVFVCLVTFFGTAFTIMAYHNDVGISNVFDDIYALFGTHYGESMTIMEISYSVGLALGIIIFFNHVFGKRLINDPTPIEVAMRKYEEEVDKAIIAEKSRNNKKISENNIKL